MIIGSAFGGFIALLWLAVHIGIIYWCVLIARSKRQSVPLAVCLGLFLWFFGLLIMAVLPDAPPERYVPPQNPGV